MKYSVKMSKSILLLLFLPGIVLSKTLPTTSILEGACSYQGSWLDGANTRFASFQGIRYAQPPIGNLRFKPPQPYYCDEDNVIDVSEESKVMCAQPEGLEGLLGQEDCLLLNVYVPENVYNDPSSKIPVMVWIHGGGLVSAFLK